MKIVPRAVRGRRRSRTLRVGVGLLVVIVSLCVIIPMVSSHGPDDFVADPLQSPSFAHPFGTDTFGRDVFLRVWAGGRLDLLIAVVVVVPSLLLGTVIGVLAGMSPNRWVDSALMRTVDAAVAFPFIILILALIVIVGQGRSLWFLPPGAPAVIGAMLIIDWTLYARLARARTYSLREHSYVLATRMLGYPRRQVVRRHLLPTVLGTTASYAVADVVIVIVNTAALAFLGAGVQAPAAEWGAIMYEGRAVLETAWWVTVSTGVVLAVSGLAVSLVADALLKVER